jgi:SOS response regulatory protein OraA/RecX
MYLVDEFDKLKTKILKYILYKPKTEYEVRNKFSDKYDKVVLEDVIKWLKKEKYIDDNENINLIIADYLENKNFSVKELIYNLNLKGISYENIEKYCTLNKINLDLYEYNSAENIVKKK